MSLAENKIKVFSGTAGKISDAVQDFYNSEMHRKIRSNAKD
jgi:hypothetical protein